MHTSSLVIAQACPEMRDRAPRHPHVLTDVLGEKAVAAAFDARVVDHPARASDACRGGDIGVPYPKDDPAEDEA